MLDKKTQDIVIIGGGVVGVAIARELISRYPTASITILDKEDDVAVHASGRNSGVIHAGFYYSPDSLKAKLTADGNRLLRAYCEEHAIPIRNTGKLVLASNEVEVASLRELLERGKLNGVRLEHVVGERILEIEPRATNAIEAIWSPDTAVSDPKSVVRSFAEDFRRMGGQIEFGCKVHSIVDNVVSTSNGNVNAGFIVNAAGLYADRVAAMFGMCDDYVMLPFRGLYWYAPSLSGTYKTLIYPVPDARNPFLGVHLTVTVDGSVKVGPTAVPGLWRENYRGLKGFSASELLQISASYPRFLRSPHHDVKSLIATEVPKIFRRRLVSGVNRLIPSIDVDAFNKRGSTGIRAQLLHKKTGRLEMDFVLRGDEKSAHILNAVSPAWTSSLSFASYAVDNMRL
jgi:L-2-hydroxyglutarate oxidase